MNQTKAPFPMGQMGQLTPKSHVHHNAHSALVESYGAILAEHTLYITILEGQLAASRKEIQNLQQTVQSLKAPQAPKPEPSPVEPPREAPGD